MASNSPFDQKATYDAARYWSERLDLNWSLQGVGYLGYSERYNQYLYRSKLRAIRRVMETHEIRLRGSFVLDVGPGIGFWLRWYLEQSAARVGAIEIADSAVARLRKAFPSVDVRNGDVSASWPFAAPADMISAFDVMYHITDDAAFERAIRNMARNVRGGGWLILTDQLGNASVTAASHVRFRSAAAYRALLDDEGFEIVETGPVYRLMNGGLAGLGVIPDSGLLHGAVVQMENILAPVLYHLDALPLRRPNLRLLAARKSIE